ncbi:MAG TPA: DUF3786 domain-containing protein [Thermodesulfovibrionales bacterium]|nr:DUF3786 domain-containing protein [Thermodesulfovibrionales bacterium]
MNAVDLYRNLPKKNCGSCRQKACMPFALSVIKGDAMLSDCPLLTVDEVSDLQGRITTADWREDLIRSLREKMTGADLRQIQRDLGGRMQDNALVMPCLGREFEISPEGEISSRSHITPWTKILLLHYINTHGTADLSGTWVSYSELKSGMVKASSFLRECEDPLKELFDADPGKTAAALEKLGAKHSSEFPTPSAWKLYLLPKVPAVVLYWQEEDEFPSKVKILFDQTADRFLDAESLMFLLEGLVKNIEMLR